MGGKPFDPEAFDQLGASIAMKRRQHEDSWYTSGALVLKTTSASGFCKIEQR